MLSRPADASGDVLPVMAPSDLLSGPPALAAGLHDHLNLFPGEWWETPDRGNPVFDLISVSRRTEQDAQTLASCLVSYVSSFPDVQSVSDVRTSFSGRIFSFSCTVHTETGETLPLHFSAP